MAESDKVEFEIKAKGADKAAAELNKVSKAANDAGKSAESNVGKATAAWGKFNKVVNGVSGAIGQVTKALGLIGLAIQGVQLIIAAFQKLHDWLNKDAEEAKRLNDEAAKASVAKAANDAAAAHERLNDKIKKSVELSSELNSLADARTKAERANEDARMDLEMAQELAALDPNDPDYAAKQSLVRNKYARRKSESTAKRAQEDSRAAIARNNQEAAAKDNEALELDRLFQGKVGDASLKARHRYFELKRRADKGDEAAKEQLGQAEADWDAARGKAVDVQKRRDAARAEADAIRRRGSLLAGAALPAQMRNSATQIGLDMQDRDTRLAMDRAEKERQRRDEEARAREAEQKRRDEEKRQKEAEEEAKRASALAAVGALTGQRGGILAQIEGQQALKEGASRQVFDAQNALSLATANNDRAGIKSSSAALASARENAQNVDAAADKVIADLSATLKSIEQRLAAASNYLKQQQSQSAYAWAEAPAGE